METSEKTATDWQKAFLLRVADDEDAKDSLFNVLELAGRFEQEFLPLDILCESFGHWLEKADEDLNKKRPAIQDFVGHVRFLHQLKTEFSWFDLFSCYSESNHRNATTAQALYSAATERTEEK